MVQKVGAQEYPLAVLRGDSVVLVQLKAAEFNDRLIARVVNHGAANVVAELTLPGRGLRSANRCDTLEQPLDGLEIVDNTVMIPLAPHAIATVELSVADGGA